MARTLARPPSTGRYAPRIIETRGLREGVASNGNDPDDVPPATVGEDVDNPGDPSGVDVVTDGEMSLHSTSVVASPWSGWPREWDTPLWGGWSALGGGRLGELVDTAWGCLDLNSGVLATMPVYQTLRGEVIEGFEWLENPDPDRYASWVEFAKNLFWDYQLGEAFVLCTARYDDGTPARFHVAEPWTVTVEMDGPWRRYFVGGLDVTAEVLHIRYKSTASEPRGHGPLEAGRARLVAAGLLSRYASEVVSGGGVPYFALVADGELTALQADNLLGQWWESRRRRLGMPAVFSGGVKPTPLQTNPKDMALVELAQFNESRIAVLCGVPPFLQGLPSGGDSMTYSNVAALFDYHDRASLRVKSATVMSALSYWALPPGERVELNRDEYTRPDLAARAQAWAVLHGIEDDKGRVLDSVEIRRMERFVGATAPQALTGGAQ